VRGDVEGNGRAEAHDREHPHEPARPGPRPARDHPRDGDHQAGNGGDGEAHRERMQHEIQFYYK
jgi:hypothetical protein